MRYLVCYIVFFAIGCASIKPLDGGSKDEQAPVVLHTYPDSAQLNIHPEQIRITFDEYVNAQNMRDLLIISPSLISEPETEIKKKTLIIHLNDSLLPQTTYSVLLNGSIVDNNEGNVLEDYQLSFSTGSYLDSMRYEAVIIDAYTKTACSECLLVLYTSQNDSAPLLQKPVYLARTSKSGKAVITHLAPQSFRALALKDENKNLLLNDQEYTSVFKTVQIDDSVAVDSFYIFPHYILRNQKAKLLRSYPGIIKLAFERPLNTKNVHLLNGSDSLSITYNPFKDTLTAYVNATEKDTFSLQLKIDTTVQTIHYVPSTLPKFIAIKAVQAEAYRLELSSKQHIAVLDRSKILLEQDSVTVPLDSIYYSNEKVALYHHLEGPFKLIINDSAIQDINGSFNLKDTVAFQAYHSDQTQLIVDIRLLDSVPYIMQLYRDKFFMQRNLRASQKLEFNQLSSGSYRIRLIKDLNDNGIWDTGDLLLGIPPEDCFISESLELRSNWDKQLIISY